MTRPRAGDLSQSPTSANTTRFGLTTTIASVATTHRDRLFRSRRAASRYVVILRYCQATPVAPFAKRTRACRSCLGFILASVQISKLSLIARTRLRRLSVRLNRTANAEHPHERSERPGSFSPSFYEEWFAAGEPDEVKSGSGLVGVRGPGGQDSECLKRVIVSPRA
jgi:hypothetical protein